MRDCKVHPRTETRKDKVEQGRATHSVFHGMANFWGQEDKRGNRTVVDAFGNGLEDLNI